MYDHRKSLGEEFESLKSEVKELKKQVKMQAGEKSRESISNYLEPTKRENGVLKYIEVHPNCTKQEVVDHFKGELSRTPVYKIIKTLVNEGRIRDKPDSKNRQTSRLIVDNTSLLNTVLKELDQIKNHFIALSQKVLRVVEESRSDPGFLLDGYIELAAKPYFILDAIMESYTVRSTLVWPHLLPDEEILRRLIAIVFVRITDILLHHMPQIYSEDAQFFRTKYVQRKLQGTISMKVFFDFSKKFELGEVMNPVLDDLWNINKDIQEYAYPEILKLSWRGFKRGKDGWRKHMELAGKHTDQVLTQIPLGESIENLKP